MRTSVAGMMVVVCLFAGADVAAGGLKVVAESVSMESPPILTAGYFDVYFDYSAGDGPFMLAGYQLALNLTPPDGGVALVDAHLTNPFSSHPPVFPSGNPFVMDTGNRLEATDFLLSGALPIHDLDGMLRVEYWVAPGTVGTFNVTIDSDPAGGTLLSDDVGSPISFTPQHGQIVITPEPSSLTLLLAGAWAVLRRRRRA